MCAICKALFLLLLLRGMDNFGGMCFPWFMFMSIAMYNLTGCEKLYMDFTRFKVNVCSRFYVHWLYLGISFLYFPMSVEIATNESCCCARKLLLCKRVVAVQGSCCCARELLLCKGDVAVQGSRCCAR
jgi:hypothetical protein